MVLDPREPNTVLFLYPCVHGVCSWKGLNQCMLSTYCHVYLYISVVPWSVIYLHIFLCSSYCQPSETRNTWTTKCVNAIHTKRFLTIWSSSLVFISRWIVFLSRFFVDSPMINLWWRTTHHIIYNNILQYINKTYDKNKETLYRVLNRTLSPMP